VAAKRIYHKFSPALHQFSTGTHKNHEHRRAHHCFASDVSFFSRVWFVIQFTSHVFRPSSENDCSKCGDFVVVFDQINRTKTDLPFHCSWSKKLGASILEFADHPLAQSGILAVGPIDSPLLGLRIVQTEREAFDVAGLTGGFELFQICAAIPDFRVTEVPSYSTHVVEAANRSFRRDR
jgi:hypothetical protein